MPMPSDLEQTDRAALELRKLRWELSFWARAAAVAVPIAAFVVAASQTYIAMQDAKSKDLLAMRDLDMKRIESAEKLVEFTNAQTKLLLSPDFEERTRALTYASTLLPPQQACIVLNAVITASPGHADFIAPALQIRELIISHYPGSPKPAECTDRGVFDTQNTISIAMAQAKRAGQSLLESASAAVGTGTAAASPTAAVPSSSTAPAPSASCNEPDDAKGLPLVVYYQIVQAADRQMASRIGFEMPADFPSAGIEFVQAVNVARLPPQVRYYYPDQQRSAEWLACLLTDAHVRIAGAKPRTGNGETDFKAVSLVGRYKDLPPHRVEVWFPPIVSQN
jgi:hypothetical protein